MRTLLRRISTRNQGGKRTTERIIVRRTVDRASETPKRPRRKCRSHPTSRRAARESRRAKSSRRGCPAGPSCTCDARTAVELTPHSASTWLTSA
eukprot:4083653-Pleurochrysis_carterae.AAC.1